MTGENSQNEYHQDSECIYNNINDPENKHDNISDIVQMDGNDSLEVTSDIDTSSEHLIILKMLKTVSTKRMIMGMKMTQMNLKFTM